MIVLDASVVYKWIIDEDHPTQVLALRLREEFLLGKTKAMAPNIIFYEIGNILSFKAALSLSDIKRGWGNFVKLNFPVISPTSNFIKKCINFSKKYHVTVYDASYAVLAQERRCKLITADEKFVKSVNLPNILHLLHLSVI
ncbi:type II toxin-antitoxin system VapC family toxin [Candidatus Daviesbacteria bacterium]|nr:type II toxin-antitoxin system VapC family toxin [Candidatus Daviesbacteria bacterium]